MSGSDIISVIAIILSPAFAVLVGRILQSCAEKRADKLKILSILIGSYEDFGTDERRAFYTIPIVFHKSEDVMRRWEQNKRIIEMGSSVSQKRNLPFDASKNTPTVFPELIKAMAKDLGYPKITMDEIRRIRFKSNPASTPHNKNHGM